ncbi:endonuclease/exonuclease/phosphatase family protein [Caulobacter hibisci]|uniref:Endonuclease/exonuclease/phosphatase family protein n=1 Tax=Caulobacter hibisci TaxID=2035993 RepID=A0ABS0SVD6_9CAUL|nr:endonuclease/exonuclease/phosphatase family protein [Caulobacter hibisci]MBI1683605.1 endonuclease/exonuclease/phosphatase family protein [Caulobacter hibisci]
MTARFLALALSLVLASPAAAETASLWVMSYNIRYDNPNDAPDWRARRGPMADQIRFVGPDVLGVQEALPPMVEDLDAALPGYDHYGVGRDDGAGEGETTTVFYRADRFERLAAQTHWCSPTPDRPSKAYDAALPRTFTRVVLRDRRSGTLIDIRNAHLDHVGAVSRERCARQILDLPAWPDAALITLGDFNSGPADPPHRLLTAPGAPYVDARAAAATRFGPEGTFNDFQPRPRAGQGAIDFLFVDRRLAVRRFATLTDTTAAGVISDHFPIVAELSQPAPQSEPR